MQTSAGIVLLEGCGCVEFKHPKSQTESPDTCVYSRKIRQVSHDDPGRHESETERLFGGYSGGLLVSVSLAWATLQFGRFLLSPLLPAIITDLGLTAATAGLTLGGFQLLYAVIQFPSGRVSDVFDRPAMVAGGLVILIASFALLAGATTPAVFLIAVLTLGLGKGLFAVPSRAQLSDSFVAKRGQALGIYAAGTDVGGILAAIVGVLVTGGSIFGAVALSADVSWRVPFAPLAGLLVVVTIGYILSNREPYRVGRPSLGLVTTIRRLATTREQREALIAFALFYFVVGAWVNFLPAYLTATKDFSEATAAGVFAVVFVVGFVVKPVAGGIADRIPRRGVAVGGLLISIVALAGVMVSQQLGPVVVATALYAFGYKSVFPVVDALLLDGAPDANVGGDLGAARALFLGVGAFGPVYLGWVVETAGYQVGFVGLGGCLLIAVGLLARGLRSSTH